MEGGAERGLESQRTTNGRESSDNGSNKAICVPSCCLKARASAPKLDAKCHSTVVSGWFSEIRPSSDKSLNEVYFNNPIWPDTHLAVGESHSLKVEKILFKEKSKYQEVLVFQVSKKFFRELAIGFEDPRMHLHVGDDSQFYITSSYTWPFEVSSWRDLFFETIARALRPGGVLCNMAESMWLHTHLIQDMLSVCRDIFKGSVRYTWASVPTYPSGIIGFLLCSTEGPPVDFVHPVNPIEKLDGGLDYRREIEFYNPEIHRVAFALPSFVRREVEALRC